MGEVGTEEDVQRMALVSIQRAERLRMEEMNFMIVY